MNHWGLENQQLYPWWRFLAFAPQFRSIITFALKQGLRQRPVFFILCGPGREQEEAMPPSPLEEENGLEQPDRPVPLRSERWTVYPLFLSVYILPFSRLNRSLFRVPLFLSPPGACFHAPFAGSQRAGKPGVSWTTCPGPRF